MIFATKGPSRKLDAKTVRDGKGMSVLAADIVNELDRSNFLGVSCHRIYRWVV